ncbi:MAG: hypothetical protein AB9861_12445 [Methanosarcina sp.]
MKRLQREAIVLSLIEHMEKNGSWCGETHIQKASYLLEELFKTPLGFEFVLYKHGPYSFDLSDELTAMRADYILEIKTKVPSYGPSLLPAENSQLIKNMYPQTLERYEQKVKFVAEKVGSNGVSFLEQLATALYVTCREDTERSIEARSKRINELKPHVTIEEAREAIKMIDKIIDEAQEVQ